MKIFSYAHLCEDIQLSEFLKNYLRNVCSKVELKGQINFNLNSGYPIKGGKISPEIVKDAVIFSFLESNVDLFFIGRDNETEDEKREEKIRTEIENSIPPKYKKKTIVFIPVQCIEHWLLYLKKKQEDANFNKSGTLESTSRKGIKQTIYGDRHKLKETRVEVVEELTTDFNINWLSQHSKSFRTFHNQVIIFLRTQDLIQ